MYAGSEHQLHEEKWFNRNKYKVATRANFNVIEGVPFTL